MKRALLWMHLMHKRTLKRPAFWVILLLIPLLTAALSAVKKDAGIVTAAVYLRGDEEENARLSARLEGGGEGVIRLLFADSPEEARRAVGEGGADCAWILTRPADTAKAYAQGSPTEKILVIERESNVFLTLARERLFSALLPEIERAVFARDLLALGADPAPTEEEIDSYYHIGAQSEELVEFTDLDGSSIEPAHYLTSPVRGLLALFIGAAGGAAAVYFAQDEKNGVFLRLTRAGTALLAPASFLLPMLDLAAVSYLALWIAGLLTAPFYEALCLLLYVLAAAALWTLLWALFRGAKALSLDLLFFVLATLALTPVFLQIERLDALSKFLPAYHYLFSIHSRAALGSLALYAAVCLAAAAPLALLRKRD